VLTLHANKLYKPYIIGNNERELGGSLSFANEEFVCPSALIAGARRQVGVNSWRYRFYAGYSSDSPIAAGIVAGLPNPAMHAAELSHVFGTFGSMGILGTALSNAPTLQKLDVSEEIQKVWAAFARDPENGPTKLGWPVYEPKSNVDKKFGEDTIAR
jgi:cholinesterase